MKGKKSKFALFSHYSFRQNMLSFRKCCNLQRVNTKQICPALITGLCWHLTTKNLEFIACYPSLPTFRRHLKTRYFQSASP